MVRRVVEAAYVRDGPWRPRPSDDLFHIPMVLRTSVASDDVCLGVEELALLKVENESSRRALPNGTGAGLYSSHGT